MFLHAEVIHLKPHRHISGRSPRQTPHLPLSHRTVAGSQRVVWREGGLRTFHAGSHLFSPPFARESSEEWVIICLQCRISFVKPSASLSHYCCCFRYFILRLILRVHSNTTQEQKREQSCWIWVGQVRRTPARTSLRGNAQFRQWHIGLLRCDIWWLSWND